MPGNRVMSVYADGLMRKAHEQLKDNFKKTGIYATNAARVKREFKAIQK